MDGIYDLKSEPYHTDSQWFYMKFTITVLVSVEYLSVNTYWKRISSRIRFYQWFYARQRTKSQENMYKQRNVIYI